MGVPTEGESGSVPASCIFVQRRHAINGRAHERKKQRAEPVPASRIFVRQHRYINDGSANGSRKQRVEPVLSPLSEGQT